MTSKPSAAAFSTQAVEQTAFTPGPWCAKTLFEDCRVVEGENHKSICGIIGRGRDADARLIAAAPDLFKACEDCLADRGDWVPLMFDALQKARIGPPEY